MKTLLTLTILTLTTFGCAHKQTPNQEHTSGTEGQEATERRFKKVVDFPTINVINSMSLQLLKSIRQKFFGSTHGRTKNLLNK